MIDISHLVVSIDTQRDGAVVIIRPHFENPTPLSLRYQMTVRQQSTAGTSSISQEGAVHLGEAPALVRLSLPPGTACLVHLEVFQEGLLLKEVEKDCVVNAK
jgi:hypothetical protein